MGVLPWRRLRLCLVVVLYVVSVCISAAGEAAALCSVAIAPVRCCIASAACTGRPHTTLSASFPSDFMICA